MVGTCAGEKCNVFDSKNSRKKGRSPYKWVGDGEDVTKSGTTSLIV